MAKRKRKPKTRKDRGKLTPKQLIHKGNYEDAIEILQNLVQDSPTDDNKRDLSWAILMSGKHDLYQKALNHCLDIDKKDASDYFRVGWFHVQLEDWDEAISAFQAALQFKEVPVIYEYLAIAQAKGKERYELDNEISDLIKGYLTRAIELPECDVRIFKQLADLYNFSAEGVKLKVETFQLALEQYPDANEIRFDLAQLLTYHLKQPENALTVLAPLLSQKDIHPAILLLASNASSMTGDYQLALDFQSAIQFDPEDDQEPLLCRKGHLLLKIEKTHEASACFEIILNHFQVPIDQNSDDFELKVLTLFGQALFYLDIGDLQAVDTAISNVAKLHGQYATLSKFYGFSYEIIFRVGGTIESLRGEEFIKDSCEILLHANPGILNNENKGWLYYILYSVNKTTQGVDEKDFGFLLLKASEFLNHPVLSGSLADYFHWTIRDIPSAVDHCLNYALWRHICTGHYQYCAEFEDYNEAGNFKQVDVPDSEDRTKIHEITMRYLTKQNASDSVKNVFTPFYRSFWRNLLIEGGMFKELADVNRIFIDNYSKNESFIWDLALALQYLDQDEEAEAKYREYLDQHPENISTLNNLSIILEKSGRIQEALELLGKAVELEPEDKQREKRYHLLKARQEQEIKTQELINNSVLSPELQNELNEFYWQTDVSTAELENYFNLPKATHFFVTPFVTDTVCPNCGWRLVYKTRSARNSGDKYCQNCEHTERRNCRCDYCVRNRQEQERRRKEELLRQRKEAFEQKLEQLSTQDYISWAVSKLNRREKLFAKAFLEVVLESESPTWEQICDKAKVVSHEKYKNKLLQLGLLLEHPEGGIISNPSLSSDMIKIKQNVRKISKSLRFDVFQRDNHTCQYCGRKAPDVELQVDHLLPVARGGTDDFDNLVTSCADCNSGKSAKLVNEYTEGFTIDEWREMLRQKRIKNLRERRSQLPEVMEYWAECRGMRSVPEYDQQFIHNFIEIYDATWIKAAIQIATRKNRQNYGKYVAGILRNWAINGVPDHISNPDQHLNSKKATPKQIDYIKALLNSIGLELKEFYHKTDFDELTMLDAHNLIEELKNPVDNLGENT